MKKVSKIKAKHLSTIFKIATIQLTIKYPSVLIFLYKSYNVILQKI